MKQKEYLFYGTDQTLSSTRIIVKVINKYLPKINSVIDLGCGMAAFAKAFQENGSNEITIIDHPKLDVSKCVVKDNYTFTPCDLDIAIPVVQKVDLLICTEVLEHIGYNRSLKVLDYIVSCSDIILFSAAIPRQGGLGHINEQRHNFWISEFRKRGFQNFDLFKLDLINNTEVLYWLRQNLFIFHRNQPVDSILNTMPILGNEFELVSSYVLNKEYGISEILKKIPSSLYRSIKNRL